MEFINVFMCLGLYFDFGLLFGLVFFVFYVLCLEEMVMCFGLCFCLSVVILVVFGVVLFLMNVVVMVKNMSGVDNYVEIEMYMIGMIVGGIEFGIVWLVWMVVLLFVLSFVWWCRFGCGVYVCMVVGIVLVMFVWGGYVVMDDGVCCYVYLGVDIVYFLVVVMWVGVLVVFVMLFWDVLLVSLFSWIMNGFV